MRQRLFISLVAMSVLLLAFRSSIAQTIVQVVQSEIWGPLIYLPLITSQPTEEQADISAAVKNSSSQAEVEPASLYEKLEQLAADGDQRAIFHLARINDYLQEKRIVIPPQEVEVGSKMPINGTNVVVRGLEPYYLKLYNEPNLATLDDLQAYIDVRGKTLKQIVEENPSALLDVAVSFDDYTDLVKLWELKSSYQIDIDGMTIHLLVDNHWHSVMYVGDPVEADDNSYIDFETSVDKFIEQIRGLMADAVGRPEENGGPIEQLPDISQVTFKVDWIRAKLSAQNAMTLSTVENIMLIDPVSDFSARFSDRAMDVIVVDVPNLRAKREVLQALEQ